MEREEVMVKKRRKSLPADEISMFCGQVALILKSGIPLHDGMATLCDGIEDEAAKSVFKRISDSVYDTGSLHEALKDAGIFPDYMVSMVLIGEEAGKLEEVMESLSLYYENENNVKRSVQTAITYPIVLIVMMGVVLSALITRVMPLFEEVFNNLGTEMSATGKMFMNFGLTFGKVTLSVIAAVLVVILALYIYTAITGKSERLKALAVKMPLLKKLSGKLTTARLASVLAMMLSSGLDLDKALSLAPEIVSDSLTKEKVKKCAGLMREGSSFVDAVTQMKIFPTLHTRMINVGFKAGQLDSVMKRLAKLYEEEVNEEVSKLISFIEPAMVAVLSVIIGGILISVMLPLASIMSSIG